MTRPLPADLLHATRLTRSGHLVEATAALQRMLGGNLPSEAPAPHVGGGPPTIDGAAETATAVRPELGLRMPPGRYPCRRGGAIPPPQ